MSKQTAVEFLLRELRIEDLAKGEQLSVVLLICEQAKQMEKEQICKAWDDGDYAHFYSKETGKDFVNGEEYYNETYGE